MSDNIIDFPTASARRVRSEPVKPFEFRVNGRQRAGRKRNPLRTPCNRVSTAVTIAGRLIRSEPISDFIDELAYLRRGAAAAQLLADELKRLAEQHGGPTP
jgi:hypothetical protein